MLPQLGLSNKPTARSMQEAELGMNRPRVLQQLYAIASPHPNSLWFSHLLCAQYLGKSQLPDCLGLQQSNWLELWQQHFPTASILQRNAFMQPSEIGSLRGQLLELRLGEWQELVDLLLQYRRGVDRSEYWMAQIIAAGSLSNQHLWQDLGLSSRPMLKQLLRYNYPGLVLKNTQSMRWKRFFYKQLCELGGNYVCRSPSCEACSTYSECFGQEE